MITPIKGLTPTEIVTIRNLMTKALEPRPAPDNRVCRCYGTLYGVSHVVGCPYINERRSTDVVR